MLGFLCLHSKHTLRETCTAGVPVAWTPRQCVGVPSEREGAEILHLLVDMSTGGPADVGLEKLVNVTERVEILHR